MKFASISPTFSIENNSNAPLSITIQSLRNKVDSPHKFTSVPFDKYTGEEWGNLNKKQSMSEIALGIDTLNKEEWRDNTFNTYSSVDTNFYLGALNPHSQATMKLIAKHGNAFESVRSDYQVVFVFDLLGKPTLIDYYYTIGFFSLHTHYVNIREIEIFDENDNKINFDFLAINKASIHEDSVLTMNNMKKINDNDFSNYTVLLHNSSNLRCNILIKTNKAPKRLKVYQGIDKSREITIAKVRDESLLNILNYKAENIEIYSRNLEILKTTKSTHQSDIVDIDL